MTARRSAPDWPKLRGRRNERAALDALLAAARAGRSESLVLLSNMSRAICNRSRTETGHAYVP